jgi:Ras GTPase-activating-like protein IQGAP2/3
MYAQPALAALSSIGISIQQSCERAYISRLFYAGSKISVSSTPETFDIVSSTVDVSSRKNLAQISKVLSQVTSGLEFGDDTPSYIPINEYVKRAIVQLTAWLFEGGYSHECSLSYV